VSTVDGTFTASHISSSMFITFVRGDVDHQVNGVPGSAQHGVQDFWTGVREVDASERVPNKCRNIVV
jgi:hypothetical protein